MKRHFFPELDLEIPVLQTESELSMEPEHAQVEEYTQKIAQMKEELRQYEGEDYLAERAWRSQIQ